MTDRIKSFSKDHGGAIFLVDTIKYQGPLVWNSLDTSLKTCKTLNYFKAKLKKLLLNKYT